MIALDFFKDKKEELASIFKINLAQAKSYIVVDDDLSNQDDLDIVLFSIRQPLIKVLNNELMNVFFSIRPDCKMKEYKSWIKDIMADGQGIISSCVDWHDDDGISTITNERLLIVIDEGDGYAIEANCKGERTELTLGKVFHFNEAKPHRVISGIKAKKGGSGEIRFLIAINLPNPKELIY